MLRRERSVTSVPPGRMSSRGSDKRLVPRPFPDTAELVAIESRCEQTCGYTELDEHGRCRLSSDAEVLRVVMAASLKVRRAMTCRLVSDNGAMMCRLQSQPPVFSHSWSSSHHRS